jgi:hypothetical protein
MAVQSGRCPSCGEDVHGEEPCPVAAAPVAAAPVAEPPLNPTCNCLPAAPDGWLECPHCGLAQAPGKTFCGFCGNRWPSVEPA